MNAIGMPKSQCMMHTSSTLDVLPYRVFVHIVGVVWIPADMIYWSQDVIKILQGHIT